MTEQFNIVESKSTNGFGTKGVEMMIEEVSGGSKVFTRLYVCHDDQQKTVLLVKKFKPENVNLHWMYYWSKWYDADKVPQKYTKYFNALVKALVKEE